jgi:hypothetical protein
MKGVKGIMSFVDHGNKFKSGSSFAIRSPSTTKNSIGLPVASMGKSKR